MNCIHNPAAAILSSQQLSFDSNFIYLWTQAGHRKAKIVGMVFFFHKEQPNQYRERERIRGVSIGQYGYRKMVRNKGNYKILFEWPVFIKTRCLYLEEEGTVKFIEEPLIRWIQVFVDCCFSV